LDFEAVLQKLVEKIDGAEGAALVDSDGEAVAWHSITDASRLRLRGAYLAVFVQSCRFLCVQFGLQEMRYVLLGYKGASVVVVDLDQTYFLAVELAGAANVGQALRSLNSAVVDLQQALV
jgi:predicted regulator of Ras-like GTPase activity (Roadblock/LC7/MglB family)